MKIRLVKQKGILDCGPATFAMAVGISLSKSKKILKQAGWVEAEGLNRKDITFAAHYLGYDSVFGDGIFKKQLYSKNDPIMALIPSEGETGYHFVLLFKEKVYDPYFGIFTKHEKVGSFKDVFNKAVYFIKLHKRR